MSTTATYKKMITKGYASAIENTPIENDTIRMTIDTFQLYADLNDERIEITDFIKGMTEEEIRAIYAPLPKFYFASDTNRLLVYDANTDEWVVCAEKNKDNVAKALEADHATNADNALNATNASTAEFATNATNASTAEYALNATNASTAEYATNASTAEYATNATNADHANSADSATNASTAEFASSATNADHANSADSATNASTAEFASSATNASTAEYATNASTAEYADNSDKSLKDANGDQINIYYAPLQSPMFTGTPSVPTPATGSKDSQIANTEFVINAIVENMGSSGAGGVMFRKFDSFEELPETGLPNSIYLVPNSDGEEGNYYYEYIWINESYEMIGSTNIDLSGYFNSIEVTGTGNAITGVNTTENGIQFTKDASFLTEHPSVSKNSSTATETPNAGSTIEVVDSVTVDNYGHLIDFRKKTVTIPDSVSNASTAVYANNAGTATVATGDGAGNNINETYIKNVSVSGKVITFTKGNGSTFSITTQDNNTTYANYKGATTAAAGTAGLVPSASTANRTKFLRGDGTWQTPNGVVSTASNGLCPKRSGTTYTFLRGDGTWTSANVTPAGESDFDFGDLDG